MKLLSKNKDTDQNGAIVNVRPKKRRNMKKLRRILLTGIAVLAAGALCLKFFVLDRNAAAGQPTYQYVTVERRNISKTLSGTGTLNPIETYTVDSLVSGEILEAPFEEGDAVKEGDLLYKIDTGDLERSIERQKLTVEKAQMSLDDLLEADENLSIRSGTSGIVSKLYVSEGDRIQSGTAIADIYDNSYMLLKVPFNSSDAAKIKIGQTAGVTLDNSFETLSGTVTEVNNVEKVLDGYMIVKYVTIKVKNPGGLTAGSFATATVGDIACNSGASFEALTSKTVKAETSGEVSKIFASEGEYIDGGDLIALLKGDTSDTQIKSAEMSLTDAKLTLDDLYDEKDSYNITSPINGTVISKNYNAGETVGGSGSNPNDSSMAVIYDMSKLTFELNIDELDVGLVKEGQKVTITADAVEGAEFTGCVSNVSISGTTQNGVTTYPATVIIDEPGSLLPGMNVTAEIVLDSVENVLAIPVSAVSRGNTVLVNSDSESAKNAGQGSFTPGAGMSMPAGGTMPSGRPNSGGQGGLNNSQNSSGNNTNPGNAGNTGGYPINGSASGGFDRLQFADNAPDGYTRVRVTLGINDDDYIEVKSGLTEGDTVAIEIIETTNSQTGENGMSFGFGGASQSRAVQGNFMPPDGGPRAQNGGSD